ncbi:uncharacterized protein LOC131674108 [Phymastichus coffea]|uniref:uncharacterized protein LOC131674108 n=1 Tax=Phymastichus coffea TaxID=108790 RepID=UPI00273C1DFE|nr:uncharacterized protein LOC131674108 [Phymastichus coffea]
MFRQVLIDDQDIHLQRIVWCPTAGLPLQHYALRTVTYGTACAPYLALRTMKQLSDDEGEKFPLAREVLNQDLYMDDFLSGGHDLDTTRNIRDQLIGLLAAGGFHLRKWVANDPALLEEIPPDDRLRPSWVQLSAEGPVRELGVAWDPVEDNFKFGPGRPETSPRLTKRTALAELAGIFDPVGWLTPLTLVAKLLIQDMWRAKLDWDEDLPKVWTNKWLTFRTSIHETTGFAISRWISHFPDQELQLHAFSDASRRALAAVVYSRAAEDGGRGFTTIIGAKSKLASIKSLMPASERRTRMTIPRLELRATLIAAQLLRNAAAALSVPLTSCHLWSDSQVTLHWLRSDSPVGHDLIDNYVAHIQELAEGIAFHHVPTDCNPADVATRGTDATQLAHHPLWWKGPAWLPRPTSEWPKEEETVPLATTSPCLIAACTKITTETDYIERFSSLGALLRGTARTIRILRCQENLLAPVAANELRHAFVVCAKISQRRHFAEELARLSKDGSLQGCHQLKSLEPFMDVDGAVRVGGRLARSPLPFDERHPILLHGKSAFAQLVIRWAHERCLHGGFRATYSRALQRAWITGARVRIKKFIHHCTLCARLTARPASQQMAALPPARVTPARPFSKCGVDYAGPFSMCRNKGRGAATLKGYVALFVCLCTKAVHLELVSDLTTASFLGAFTRFVGRRGRPAEVWSDNGTNFRGAALELRRLLREAEIDWGVVEGELAKDGTSWKFIPPSAPHFGGLWEAGVKSMKRHLMRVASPRRLTYEELTTLLVSIEATLNSRPLIPPAGDLGDIEALTPSHFLIGTSATSYPQTSSANQPLDRASHWELVQAMRSHFWTRWSREYLNTLLQRSKWKSPQPNLEVGDFVILLDPTLLRPDGRWPLGRVTATMPGSDGLVRAVTVKTATGEYTRPIVKIARLPVQDTSSSSTAAAPSNEVVPGTRRAGCLEQGRIQRPVATDVRQDRSLTP